MEMLRCSTQFKIRRCFQCQGDTEFYCNTCEYDLCLQCKEKHVFDLQTKYHDVLIYREKYEYITKQETCMRHPDRIYAFFCISCELPLCFQCIALERIHQTMDIRIAYEIKRQQHREIIHNIRSEVLYNSLFLMAGIKTDIKSCTQILSLKSVMSTKAQRLKNLIDSVIWDVKIRYIRYSLSKIPEQKRKMNRYLASIENYVDISEHSANRPVKFLLFRKKTSFPKIEDTSGTQHTLLSSTQKSNTKDMITLMSEITILERGRRQVRIEDVLKLMASPVLHRSVTVPCVSGVTHISCVTSDLVWINDYYKLILTNTTGDAILYLFDIWSYTWSNGAHSMNKTGDLIYIDRGGNINRLSKDNSTSKTLIEKTSSWQPQCVYCSQSNEDILVMMWNTDKGKGKGMLKRYNYKGQLIQTIEHKESGQKLYSCPIYITENRNGDVIVSDFIDYYHGALVVTGRGGKYLFSYRGPPTGSGLRPHGICTDVLQNILVCDHNTKTVQMIDKYGNFLTTILTRKQAKDVPCGLFYDDKSHLLWVGSYYKSRFCVYKYLNRQDYLTEEVEWRKSKLRKRKA